MKLLFCFLFLISCLPPAANEVKFDNVTTQSDEGAGTVPDESTNEVTDQESDQVIDSTTDISDPIVPVGGDSGSEQVQSQRCSDISEEIRSRSRGRTLIVSPLANNRVLYNSQTTTLRSVVSNAQAGDTILLEDGEYTFDEASGGSFTGIYMTKENIVLRSLSGDPTKVILNSRYLEHGNQSATITVDAPGIIIADLTVTQSIHHLIHVWAKGDNLTVHNVHLLNGGQQFLKSSPSSGRVEKALISCNKFVMDTKGRKNAWGYGAQDGSTRCYTGGIDTHHANDWLIQDNEFEGIYCESTGTHPEHRKTGNGGEQFTGGLAEHAIHMWDTDSGTTHIIERNKITNCARGIGVGLGNNYKAGSAIIRNNIITSMHAGSSEHDVGIIVEAIENVEISDNTILLTHENAYPNAIEYRWPTTNVTITNNLTNKAIRKRNEATGFLSGNIINYNPSTNP